MSDFPSIPAVPAARVGSLLRRLDREARRPSVLVDPMRFGAPAAGPEVLDAAGRPLATPPDAVRAAAVLANRREAEELRLLARKREKLRRRAERGRAARG